MFLATLWVAVWCEAYVALQRVLYLELERGDQYPRQHVLTAILLVTPFTAVGALFGRTWRATFLVVMPLLIVLLLDALLIPDLQV
jgi:hypothetical protein